MADPRHGRPVADPEGNARRTNRILELRRQRYIFRDIAEIVSKEEGRQPAYSVQFIHGEYRKAIKDIPKAMADELRTEMVEQLEDLERKALVVMSSFHFTTNNNGVVMWENPDGKLVPLQDSAPALDAIRTLVAVQQRKSKLLGLDAPTQVQATIRPVTEQDVALAQVIEQLEEANRIEAAKIAGAATEVQR